RERLQSIGDARNTLLDLLMDPAAMEQIERPAANPWKRIALLALAPMVFLAGWLAKPTSPHDVVDVQRFEISLLTGKNIAHGSREGVAMSPDGTRIAFVAKAGLGTSADEQANSELFIRGIDEWHAVPLPGTKGAVNPFFSPDGQWLGFVSRMPSQKTQIM